MATVHNAAAIPEDTINFQVGTNSSDSEENEGSTGYNYV